MVDPLRFSFQANAARRPQTLALSVVFQAGATPRFEISGVKVDSTGTGCVKSNQQRGTNLSMEYQIDET